MDCYMDFIIYNNFLMLFYSKNDVVWKNLGDDGRHPSSLYLELR